MTHSRDSSYEYEKALWEYDPEWNLSKEQIDKRDELAQEKCEDDEE